MILTMNNVDRLYRISNLLSFLGMAILLLHSMKAFETLAWFNVSWVFATLMVLMCVVIIQAKRLDLRRNNPNLVIPMSKYAYFGGFIAFFAGYLFLGDYSVGQVVAYSVALVLDVFSSLSSMVVISKMKKKVS